MPDFITLSCPSCGGKLEITQDIERFACGHCGREHIVKRGGGIVSLSPVVEGLKNVQIGVDKTAAELAITRLQKEIEILMAEKDRVLKAYPYPLEYSPFSTMNFFIVGVGFLFLSIFVSIVVFSNNAKDADLLLVGVLFIFCTLPGLILIFIGIWPIINRNKRIEEKKTWEATTGIKIKSINEQIASKQAELDHNRKLVGKQG